MDNLTLPARTRLDIHQAAPLADRSASPTIPFPLVLNSDAIELTAPTPPRLPPRGERPQDADGLQRPCPPLPPAPPIPAREPLLPVSSVSSHQTVAAVLGSSTTASRRQPPESAGSSSPALDLVVPLAHWPLPRVSQTGCHSTAVHIRDKIHVTGESRLPVGVSIPSVVVARTIINQPAKPSHVSGNLYVDPPTLSRSFVASSSSSTTSNPITIPGSAVSLTPLPSSVQGVTLNSNPSSLIDGCRTVTLPAVVVAQPTSTSSKPGHGSDAPPSSGGGKEKWNGDNERSACRGGIMCSRCGRCRCASCTAARELPRRWIGNVECSLQRCVNVTTCMCCVEAIFYHCLDGGGETCAEDGDGLGAADDPCACCERPKCCLRWTVMTALAASVLPCLCCHCPMQCALTGVKTCYNACATPNGCQCQASNQESSSGGSMRGLLAESESSST